MDLSRSWTRAGADTPVAGRDDRVVLPDSAGSVDWLRAVVHAAPGSGKPDCNSAVRDRSAGRSRTARHNRDTPARGGSFRQESPRHPPGGMDNSNRIMAGWKQLSDGDLPQVAKPEPRCSSSGVLGFPPNDHLTLFGRIEDAAGIRRSGGKCGLWRLAPKSGFLPPVQHQRKKNIPFFYNQLPLNTGSSEHWPDYSHNQKKYISPPVSSIT